MKLVIPFVFFFLMQGLPAALAAPCCAGSNALPSVITGDERAFLSVSASAGSVIGDAPGAGKGLPVFRDELSNRESRRILTLNAATLISDRFQIGTSVPFVQNQVVAGRMNDQSSQWGDLSFTLGYEALPEWEYSPWKPRIFTFVQWVVPTGNSVEQSTRSLMSDVSGLGVHQLHLGMIAIKRWSDWDLNSVMKLGKEWSFSSAFLNASLGGGYSFLDNWRLGMSLDCAYQSPRSISTQKLVWNTGATLTWLMGSDSSWIAGYSDQTLLGPAFNTTLSRTVSLAFVQRFER